MVRSYELELSKGGVLKPINDPAQKAVIRGFILLFILILVSGSPVLANVKMIKAYKEAYPDEKPKCQHCHVDEKPKKEDGKHDMNEYGKKVLEIAKEPTAETFKKAGK